MKPSLAMNDEISVGGGSTVSHWSASFKAHFPWLPPLAAISPTNSNDSSEKNQQQQEKENEILACLHGSYEDETVDLWKLRQLALTKGGLLSPHLRKRAWPKLVGAHEHVLHHAAVKAAELSISSGSSVASEQVGISKSDLNMLKRDVSQSVWNVEEHVLMSRYQEEAKHVWAKRSKRVTFVPGLAKISPTKSSDTMEDNSPPPVGSIHMEQGDSSVISPSGTFSPNSQVTMDTFSTKTSARPRASRQEQKILFNTIVSVLRTPPPAMDYEEDDRFFYYHGLHDVTALLLINLESPSLTNLVLGQLATHSLRDALRNPRARSLERAIDLTLFALLKKVDPLLHQHVTSCMEIPSFCLSWMQCWFARDLRDARAASRLLDVCLASHALMPIYLSIAMMCHLVHRSRILNTECNVKSMHSVLRNLPKDMIQTSDDTESAMEILEEMIESAVGYIKSYPPSMLVPSPCVNLTTFQDPPLWSTAPFAPTDYALLQYAKQIRKGEATSAMPDATAKPRSYQYLSCALAMAASGVKTRRSLTKWLLMVGALLMVLLLVLAGTPAFQELLAPPEESPSFATRMGFRKKPTRKIYRASRPLNRPKAAAAKSMAHRSPFETTRVAQSSTTSTASSSSSAAAVPKTPMETSSSTEAPTIVSVVTTATQKHALMALVLIQNSAVVQLLTDPRVTAAIKTWWKNIQSLPRTLTRAIKSKFPPREEQSERKPKHHTFGEFLL